MLRACALLALLVAASPAAAQTVAVPADSAAARIAPPDSLPPGLEAVGVSGGDTVRVAARPQHWSDQPRFVMARSLVLPGWGQFYNHAWIKGTAVAGTETWFIVTLVQDHQALNDLQAEIDDARSDQDIQGYADAVSRYNDRLDTFVAHQWLFGAVLAYALIDAYVDAHFRNFDIEFRHDPALPDDLPADPPSKGGGPARGAGTRVALRWHF